MLKNDLKEWQDIDTAAFCLACAIGLMKEGDFQVKAKHVFWSNNPIGDMLYEMLKHLVKVGILEENPDPEEMAYRWNPNFKGSWENEHR